MTSSPRRTLLLAAFVILGVSRWWGPVEMAPTEVKTVHASEPPAAAPAAAPMPAAPSDRVPAATPVDERVAMLAALRDTRDCYETLACDFSQADPRAYDFAVGRKLAADLKQFRERFGPDAELAREFLAVDDGFVREEALRMLAELPTDPESLAALSEHLAINSDPDIAERALTELSRYLGTPEEPRVHDLITRMLQGPHFSAERTSLGVLTFVNEASAVGYRDAVDQLPPSSIVGRNVTAALTEFERRRQGG